MVGVIYDSLVVALNTSVGTQAIVGNLGGHTAKGAIVHATRCKNSDGVGAIIGYATISAGVTDGTDSRMASAMSEHSVAAASMDTGRRTTTTLFQVLATTSEAVLVEGSISSMDTNGITINITTTDGGDYLLHVFMIGGDNVQCKVGTLACSATEDASASVTSLAFAPRWIYAVGGVGGFATGAGTMRFTEGFAAFNDLAVQGQAGVCATDADTPSVSVAGGQGLRTDSILQRIVTASVGGALTEEARYEVTAALSNGFTVTTRAGSTGINLGYLAVYTGNSRSWAGDTGLDTTVSTTQSVAAGWKPQAAICIGTILADVNTYYSAGEGISWSIGATDGAPDGCCSYQSEDNVGTSDTHSSTSTTLVRVISHSINTDWSATFAAFTSTGISVTIGTTSGTSRKAAMLLLEEDRKDPGWWDARSGNRWRRQLARM